jgi:hypothetical protein
LTLALVPAASWFRAYAMITVTDLRQVDIQFCAEHFGARPWQAGIDLDALEAPGQYDLIWLGSVFSHFSAENSIKLLHKLISWANPGAIVMVTLHGRRAIQFRSTGHLPHLHDEGWQKIELEHGQFGYGYADYENQTGYGISLTKLEWSARLIRFHGQCASSATERASVGRPPGRFGLAVLPRAKRRIRCDSPNECPHQPPFDWGEEVAVGNTEHSQRTQGQLRQPHQPALLVPNAYALRTAMTGGSVSASEAMEKKSAMGAGILGPRTMKRAPERWTFFTSAKTLSVFGLVAQVLQKIGCEAGCRSGRSRQA